MSLKLIVLKSLQISQESTCFGVFFNKVRGPQNYNFIKTRLQHRFLPLNFSNYLRTPILQRIYEQLVLKHQCAFLQKPFFTDHLQCLHLTVSDFQPVTSFKKRPWQRIFSVNFGKFLKTSFVRTPPDDCYLSLKSATLLKETHRHRCFLVNFAKLLRISFVQNTSVDCFCIRVPLENCLFQYKLPNFSHQIQ